MADEDKENIHQVIADGIATAMKPVYWGISGIMLTVLIIFVSVAWPISNRVNDLHSDYTKKIDSEEAYRNFVTKVQYNIMQGEEHRFDSDAILNPLKCHDIYRESDRFRANQLEIRYRSAE